MPEAALVRVAQAVVAHLAQQTFSVAIEPDWSFANWKTEELKGPCADRLRVDVVPVTTGQEALLSSRESVSLVVPIDVAVRRRLGPSQQEDQTGKIERAVVAGLCLLTQELHLALLAHRFTDFESTTHRSTKLMTNPNRKHLTDWRQFTGWIRLVFDVDVDLP